MRFFLLPLLLLVAFRAFAADPVLKFTLTKADGTPAVYEFLVPIDTTDQGGDHAGHAAVLRFLANVLVVRLVGVLVEVVDDFLIVFLLQHDGHAGLFFVQAALAAVRQVLRWVLR